VAQGAFCSGPVFSTMFFASFSYGAGGFTPLFSGAWGNDLALYFHGQVQVRMRAVLIWFPGPSFGFLPTRLGFARVLLRVDLVRSMGHFLGGCCVSPTKTVTVAFCKLPFLNFFPSGCRLFAIAQRGDLEDFCPCHWFFFSSDHTEGSDLETSVMFFFILNPVRGWGLF